MNDNTRMEDRRQFNYDVRLHLGRRLGLERYRYWGTGQYLAVFIPNTQA